MMELRYKHEVSNSNASVTSSRVNFPLVFLIKACDQWMHHLQRKYFTLFERPLKTFGQIWGGGKLSEQDLKGQTLPNRHNKDGKRIGKGKTFPKEYQTIESKYVT